MHGPMYEGKDMQLVAASWLVALIYKNGGEIRMTTEEFLAASNGKKGGMHWLLDTGPVEGQPGVMSVRIVASGLTDEDVETVKATREYDGPKFEPISPKTGDDGDSHTIKLELLSRSELEEMTRVYMTAVAALMEFTSLSQFIMSEDVPEGWSIGCRQG